jgi:hypothetical protein
MAWPGNLPMQSQYGERLRNQQNAKTKCGPKRVEAVFYKAAATNHGMVATDWKLLTCNPLTTFPGNVELEPAKAQIPRLPYKHYDVKSEFHLDQLQQFLGTLQTDPTQTH